MDREKVDILIERALDGSITRDEQAELSILCKQDHSILERLEEAQNLQIEFDNVQQTSFKAGFVNRVLRRLNNQKSPTFDELIAQLFPRVAIPAFAVACLIMISNVMLVSPGTPLIDALFALSSDNSFTFALF